MKAFVKRVFTTVFHVAIVSTLGAVVAWDMSVGLVAFGLLAPLSLITHRSY